MLDFLKSLFKTTPAGNTLSKMSLVTGHLGQIILLFEQEYGQDHNAYNAALDTVSALAQQAKRVFPTPAVPTEANQAIAAEAQPVTK